jgi:hypothetical protein
MTSSAEYVDANQYIQSPRVAELNVTSQTVHEKLWPLFEKMLAMPGEEDRREWIYASAFKYAVGLVKDEYRTTNEGIKANTRFQYAMCFYFIMYIHH